MNNPAPLVALLRIISVALGVVAAIVNLPINESTISRPAPHPAV